MMIEILSLFSGIGAFEEGFKKVRNIKVVGFSENDDYSGKMATKVYEFFHGETRNLGKVQEVDGREYENIDIITHGSPCQSFSAVNRVDEIKGGKKGSGTKSSLMWETVRIVREAKPKIVVWENVKAVFNKKNKPTFNEYIRDLNNLGYNNYYEVLNGINFGIPQDRDRIFVISIRKDVDNGKFKITKNRKKAPKLATFLEEKINETTIVPFEQYDSWENKKGDFGNRIKITDITGYASTLTTKPGVGAVTNDFILVDKNDNREQLYKLKGKELIKELKDKQIRIRFLSISERFKLMGFDDTELKNKNYLGISYSQLGKMTGNSIITTIPESIMIDITKSNIL